MSVLAPVWGGDPARLARLVATAFGLWERVADLEFRPAGPGERPDILIGAQGTPERIAFANVWHAAAPAGGDIASLTRATICFNPQVAWTTAAKARRPRAASISARCWPTRSATPSASTIPAPPGR